MAFKFSKKLKWFLVIPVVIIAFFVITFIQFSTPPNEKEINEKFIVVNPLDLSQISGLSKYRSCAGHDYRGPIVQTGKKEATPRSMKHYIKMKEELAGKNGVVKAIAPFDGEIFDIVNWEEVNIPEDQNIWLTPDTNEKNPRKWIFIFFHIDLKDGLEKGSKVKAGEVIGTAHLRRGPEKYTDNFDMAVKFMRPMNPPAIDLPLSHATAEVFAEYEKLGVTLPGLEIPEEYRDQNPCPTTGEVRLGDVFFPASTDPNDWVYFKE